MLKLTLSLMLVICLAACASGPSTKSSSKAKPTYIGERNEAGEPHGRGVMSWSGGLYDGEFLNGLKHGQGTFTDRVFGTTYTGSFKDGLRHGQGREKIWRGGATYEGEWHKNKKDGYGVVVKILVIPLRFAKTEHNGPQLFNRSTHISLSHLR